MDELKESTVEYNLGYMIGEFIYQLYLPTLEIHALKTNKVIEVSKREKLEHYHLHNLWFDKDNNESQSEWKALREYSVMLENKYLPKELECFLPIEVNLNDNIEDVKDGIRDSLWNCDRCSYDINPKNILIENPEEDFAWYSTIVKLKLDSKI